MDDQSHDDAAPEDWLAAALDAALKDVVETHFGQVPLAVALNSIDPDIWFPACLKFDTLSKEMVPHVTRDTRFAGTTRLFMYTENGGVPCYPDSAPRALFNRAHEVDDVHAAIEWYSRILKVKGATGRICEALWGVTVSNEVRLTDTISILPIRDLRNSAIKRFLMGVSRSIGDVLFRTPYESELASSVLTIRSDVEKVLFTAEEAEKRQVNSDQYVGKCDELADVARVLTLIGPRALVSAGIWYEFDDEDLFGYTSQILSRSTRFVDILPITGQRYPVLDADAAKEVVPLFFGLDLQTQKKIRVALQRLNMAQRRHNLGDKAIDLSISLESLLSTDSNEVKHRVTTRATRLLAGLETDRVRNRDVIGAMYDYRSKMVHQGETPQRSKNIAGVPTTPAEILTSAVNLCVDVITSLLRAQKIPDWAMFDIQANA
ncbi:HEPN domain-containing protein [Paraburkholderia youngii]|uniref:Apea-like HEPN domain-containing protein n=1 Tax=Paraburkholderia youngii TaxID=2782701 RepID=A0A7Y6MY75_9BURK|nr:HEPN domain-containing protein [Paraburkholderia youngii]NUY01698.1 hypothetical protein [Paraburkholderia youngii]